MYQCKMSPREKYLEAKAAYQDDKLLFIEFALITRNVLTECIPNDSTSWIIIMDFLDLLIMALDRDEALKNITQNQKM